DLATGDGIYKSPDAGKTWMHLGLRDAQQIAAIIVDPKDPNRLFVAAIGHPYGPNAERGVFRSTDGGKTFQKVLYKDENTGAADLGIGGSQQEWRRVCFERCRGLLEAYQFGPSHWRTRPWGNGNRGCARQSGCSLRGEHDDVEIEGWRENVCWLQRRAGRRRLPTHLD